MAKIIFYLAIPALVGWWIYSFTVFQKGGEAVGMGEKPPFNQTLLTFAENSYQKQCAACHGLTGRGDGASSHLLPVKPRDFRHDTFKIASTPTGKPTDEGLFKTITIGMPGSPMPGWQALSENERWALVYYVQILAGSMKAKAEEN